MNLHRISGNSDWEKTQPSDRTALQKIAASTHGIVSPANFITVIGLGIVIYGLILLVQEQYWLGLILLAVGRLLDIADGAIADVTKTKSAVGELFDAAADKVGTLLTIITLLVGNITFWWVIVALILPQILIPLVIFYKRQKKIRVHPTKEGKLSMASAWVSIVGLLVVKALDTPQPLSIGVYILVGVSLLLGLYALGQYATYRD